MGLSLCYELRCPAAEAESTVLERLAALRVRALELPFDGVSKLVRLTERELTGPWPMRGLAFQRLEDVVDVTARGVRDDVYRRDIGIADDDWSRVDTPLSFPLLALGFAVAPGAGSEPAAFGLATALPRGIDWSWHCCCKTQYASRHGEEHLIRCHVSLVAVLDAARELGFDVVVRDDTGYWDSRDTRELVARVTEMNRIVAQFAGAFVDRARAAGIDTRQVQGAIFEHPDFERLESEE